MGWKNLQRITTHAKGAAKKRLIVAFILLGDQISDDLTLVVVFAHLQVLGHCAVGFDRANAVNTRHRSDDDHVVPFEQRAGGRVPHPVDLLVNLAFFFDVCVRAGDVGFGLVVVVVADEILHSVVWKKAFEFAV